MKVYTCFLLLRTFAYTYTIEEPEIPPADNKRSVNLALETVLEFNNRDRSADVKFLDNVQDFITKVKTVIHKNKNARRDFKVPKIDSLTDFIVEVVNLVDTFEDAAFQDFYEILDEEIRKYHYRGCKFYELTDNLEFRKFLADKLNLIKDKPVFVIRSYVNSLTDIIKSRNYDKYVKDLVHYINSLYRQDARDKFQKILENIDFFSKMKSKKSHTSFVKIIRGGIRSIIFDHYTKLTPNARRALKVKVESFWKQYKQNSSKSDSFLNVENDDHGKLGTSEFTTSVPIENKYNESEPSAHKKEKDNEKRIKIKKSDYKKKGMMRDGVKEKKIERVKFTKTSYDDDKYEKVSSMEASHYDLATRTSSEHFSGRLSSEDADLTGETLERNSIELYQKHQEEINTQRYMTLYPESITYNVKNDIEKSEKKIMHRSATISTEKPFVHTMWIEEATGRIPKVLIEKYNKINKKRRLKYRPQYESHEIIRWSKKVTEQKTKDGTRHIKRLGHKQQLNQKRKHKSMQENNRHRNSKLKPVISKPMLNKKAKIFSQDHAYIDAGTAIELYDYKKMMEPGRNIKEKESSTIRKISTPMRPVKSARVTATKRSTVSARFSVATRPRVPPRSHQIQTTGLASLPKSVNRLVTSPLQLYSKRYEMLTGKLKREFRKNAPPIPDKRLKTARRQNMNNITDKFDKDVDLNVIKRINELEKDLIEVKNKINDIKKEEAKLQKLAGELMNDKISDGLNDTLEKSKKYEVGSQKGIINSQRKDLNMKKYSIQLTGTDNKDTEYKTEIKFVKEKDKPFEEVQVKFLATQNDAETKTMKVTKRLETDDRKSEIKETEDVLNERLYLQNDNKVKLMVGDKAKIKFEAWNGDGRTEGDFINYDQDDVWKDSFKFYIKPSTKSTTTKSTTHPENTTTIRPTKSETISSMVELFISLPSVAPSTKTPVSNRKDSYVPAFNFSNKNNTTKNQSELSGWIKNVTIEDFKKEITSKSNVTIATLSVAKDENDTVKLSAEKLMNTKEILPSSPPLWSSNGRRTTNGIYFTDPFEGIDDSIEIPLKK